MHEDDEIVTRGILKKELKKELGKLRKEFKAELKGLFERLLDTFVTKIELQEIMKDVVRKSDWMVMMTKIDAILTEIAAMRQEHIFMSKQTNRMDDQLNNHEVRIAKLESAV